MFRYTSVDNDAGCLLQRRPVFQRYINVYFNVYYWFRVVFIHLLPCAVLIVLNLFLIGAIRDAHARRKQLLRRNARASECRRLAENNVTTLMLVVVVCVMLVVERQCIDLIDRSTQCDSFRQRSVLLYITFNRFAGAFCTGIQLCQPAVWRFLGRVGQM